MFGRHFQRCIWQSMISTAATKNDLGDRRFLRRVAQLSAAIHSEIIWEKLWSWLGRREREEHRHCTETVSCISFSGMGIPSHESNILNIFFLTRSWLAPSLDGVAKGHSWLDSGHWSSERETKGWGGWFEAPFCWSLECQLGKAPPVHQLLQILFSDNRENAYLRLCSQRKNTKAWEFLSGVSLEPMRLFTLRHLEAEPRCNRQGKEKYCAFWGQIQLCPQWKLISNKERSFEWLLYSGTCYFLFSHIL